MKKIKIESNPYDRKISFSIFNEATSEWEDIGIQNMNSRLREYESAKNFLPFKIKEILDIVVKEYWNGSEGVQVTFEGTGDERDTVKSICSDAEYVGKIIFDEEFRGKSLYNARYILTDIKEKFEDVRPVIKNIMRGDESVLNNMGKVESALDDRIPICVFGNYSSGKSTFINALIGCEILPSGGDPVTAKIYRISNAEQPDRAVISCECQNKNIKLIFEGSTYRVEPEDSDSELICEVNKVVEDCDVSDLYGKVYSALEILNDIEKREKQIVISDVIDISIPFSRKGVLGVSHNKFVIFDTPGSNSASNLNHSKVLENALESFSNGIPVWVSQYETVDSQDNAALCDKILQIKALDERFTMIIMNKADVSDLPENGFTSDEAREIMEFNAVEKMYSSGIYFVSSIMGLGAKKDGELVDKHYRKIFRSQKNMYIDENDEDYVTLYKYNIMPETMKKSLMMLSEQCSDKVFANSGLYGVEASMEIFAGKYAAYNKCQMVYMFLNSVIDETNKRIDGKTKFLEDNRKLRETELEISKKNLLNQLAKEMQKTVSDLLYATTDSLKSYINKNLTFEYPVGELEKLECELRKQNASEANIELHQQNLEEDRNNMWSHFKNNGQEILQGHFDYLRKMADDLANDHKEVRESRESKWSTEREIDKITSDMIMKNVVEKYRDEISLSIDSLNSLLKDTWYENAQKLRCRLIEIITGTEVLTELQKQNLSSIIINYESLSFDDGSEKRFSKKKFLKGMLFGLRVNDSEKINLRLLSNRYNKWIKDTVGEIADEVNKSCFDGFEEWRTGLKAAIEANITELNPNLRNMADLIKEETEKILELSTNRRKIGEALDDIKDLMSWTNAE